MKLPFAEEINYYKTSEASPGSWLEKTEILIEKLGGHVSMVGKGRDEDGRTAFAMEFSFPPDRFRAIYPVLPSKWEDPTSVDLRAAERQAATLLFHDVKARCLRSKIFGPRSAFFEFLLLSDGRSVAHLANEELIEYTPKQLLKA